MTTTVTSLPVAVRNRTLLKLGGYAALVIALFSIELFLNTQYSIRIANSILIQAIAALGVNVVLGFAGLVSIGHAGLMAMGAYLSALLMRNAGVPFELAFLSACAAGGALSAVIGYLGNKVKLNYLMIITLGIHQAVILLIVNENWLTGGASGLFNVPGAKIGPWELDNDHRYYVLTVLMFVLALYFVQRLRASKAGRAMIAARLHAPAAQMSAVDVNRYRIWAMAFSGVYLGAAGSLFAHLIQFLGPEDFSLANALLLTLIVVVGGLGSTIGTCLSTLGLTVVTEYFRETSTAWVFYYGVLIMVIMVVAPRGLVGIGEGIVDLLRRYWRGRH